MAGGWHAPPFDLTTRTAQKAGHSSNSGGGGGGGDGDASNGSQPHPEQNRKKGKLKEIFSGDFGTEPVLYISFCVSLPRPAPTE